MGNVTRDGDQRAGIHVSIGDGSDEIRRTRTARAHANARFASDTRVTFRRERAALFMARENGANLGGRQRLMDFHARAAGIRKNDFHAFAFEGFNEDVAAQHGSTDFVAFLGPGGFGCFRFCGFGCFAHTFFWLWPEQCGQQKTHSRFQPWVLVKIVSISTSSPGLAYYEDYYCYYLSDNSVHFALKIAGLLALGQAFDSV